MLTETEIQNTKVNLDVAKIALAEVEKRFDDLMQTKENMEKRTFPLLAGYAAMATFLITHSVHLPAIIMFVGMIFLTASMMGRDYGCKGTDPDFWLQPNTLDTDETGLAVLIAYEIYHYSQKLDTSRASLIRKRQFIDIAILFGCISIIFAMICLSL